MSDHIHSGRDRHADLTLHADVVVVGSGAGGAVVATELAEAGRDVLILEEGPYIPSEQYEAMRTSEAIRHAWRDGATTIAVPLGDTPAVNVTMGRCVGGSSMLTGGVCFRAPGAVLAEWRGGRGLRGMTEANLDPVYTHVEKALSVQEVPASLRSRSTNLFLKGAEARGIPIKPLRRNIDGCEGHGQCNFGCPKGAKKGVDRSYLPRALRAGAHLWSHALVKKIRMHRGRASGVEGRLLDGPHGAPGSRLRVFANTVVVAAGAWHTPLILKASGLGGRQAGRDLTLHPAFRMLARFDEPVRGWQGALQSAYTDHFERLGITLVGLFIPTGVLAATMPGVGRELAANAQHIDHLAMFGGLIHDEGGGRVHRVPGREPLVTYRMSRADRAKIPVVIREMAQTFFAAGAREVFIPVLGLKGQTADQFARLDLERLRGRHFESASQHPLGSCQMGPTADGAVVDDMGRVWGTQGVYVADGSIVPTSLGVNPQLTIMALATRVAWGMLGRLPAG